MFEIGHGDNQGHVRIDSSGRVMMPNQPSFAAYRDAGDVDAGNVYIFDHTHHNIGGLYATSTGRGTVPVTVNLFEVKSLPEVIVIDEPFTNAD